MIRKPTEKDFREGTTVAVLRETGRVAVATRDGARKGAQALAWLYVRFILWVGVVGSAIAALAQGSVIGALMLVGLALGIQQVLRKKDQARLDIAVSHQLPVHHCNKPDVPAQISQSGSYSLSLPVAVKHAIALGIPAVLLCLLGIVLWPVLLVGIAVLVTSALIVFKAFFDNELVTFDHHQININNLLARKTVAWRHIDIVCARPYSRLNLKVLFTIGSRRAIVLTSIEPGGKTREYLIPIDLLDLDKDGLTALVANLISCKAAGGELVEAWNTPPPQTCAPVGEYTPSPAGNPDESFDPDEIMASYLADRARVVAEVRPDLRADAAPQSKHGTQPRTFGRKVTT